MTDGTRMGTTPSSGLKGPSRALLFIISVSRWGPWWADPTNKYPHIPLPRARWTGRPQPLNYIPGACFIIVIIGLAVLVSGEVQAILCLPIVAVAAVLGVLAFILKSKRPPHHQWEKPPPHHLKK